MNLRRLCCRRIARDIRHESVNLPKYTNMVQCSWMDIPVKQQNLQVDKQEKQDGMLFMKLIFGYKSGHENALS